jgi:hypothetical protein
MSREIDLTKKLDEDELRYLVDRDMWDALRENARNLDLPEPNLPSARGIRAQVPRKQLRNTDAFDQIAKQMGVKASQGEDSGEGTTAPVLAPQQGDQGRKLVDYTKLTVPQLKEELDKRRKEYEDAGDSEAVAEVSYTNDDRKDDLVAKLQLDDEATVVDDGDS